MLRQVTGGTWDWTVPVLVSNSFKERMSHDRRFSDAFFLTELQRLITIYRRTGNPRLSYMCGKAVSDLGGALDIKGSAGLGLLHCKLAEMLIAGGASATALDQAEWHLTAGWDQLEKSPHIAALPRALGLWYMFMAVTYKARGRLADYCSLLDQGAADRWLCDHGTPADRIPVVRQQIMLRQDLDAHLSLILDFSIYKEESPLEYYRTLKRCVEFLSNRGLVTSVASLKREFISAFARVSSGVPLIAHVSFAKNLAQILALEGDREEAARAANAALTRARVAGLQGQVRQLRLLSTAIDQNDVRGALMTFRT